MKEKRKILKEFTEMPTEGNMKRIRYEDPFYTFKTFSRFPRDKWKEYEKDVIENHGNTRWAKAWSDHLLAKQKGNEELILAKIELLEQRIEEVASGPKPEMDVVKTLGGEVAN